MKRKKYIVGNWKMFKTAQTAYNDFLILQNNLENQAENEAKSTFHLGICAPSVFLQQLADVANNIHIYAQNVYWEKEGAFTGEISVPMLKSIGVEGSLVGHSERRHYFHETNLDAGKKLKALLKNEMRAIYCVGESLQERENGEVQSVIQEQLHKALELCRDEIEFFGLMHAQYIDEKPSEIKNQYIQNYMPLCIAYEPIWAIGTGKAATVKDARDVHLFIRATLAKMFGVETSERTRILYGGSVKLSNAKEFLSDNEIDGALVGGASLDPNEFFKLFN